MDQETDVAVVGAGVWGLTAAHHLARRGLQVRLLEAGERAGGAIRSIRLGGFLAEHGPNSLLDTGPHLHRLFAELGLEGELVWPDERARNRYVLRGGRLHPLPTSPPALLKSGLFSAAAKLRLLAEPFIGRAPEGVEETLAQFVERRLGREFLDYAIDAFVAGVYAGVPEKLSTQAAFPKLHALEKEYGSLIKGALMGARKRRKSQRTGKQSARLFAFRRGMETLVEALAAERGESLHLGAALRALQRSGDTYTLVLAGPEGEWRLRARAVVLTLPAHAYGEVEFGFECPVRQALLQIPYPPVCVVFLGYEQAPGGRPLDGFGFLIPRCEQRRILGTIWNSALFPDRAPQGGAALTSFVGGVRQPELALFSEGELVDLVRAELRQLMGVERAPDQVFVRRWQRAIPQYQPGHGRIVEALLGWERTNPGLYVGGNFRGGISVGDCLEQAQLLAERLVAERGAT